ncbi:MAG: hypothetical protein HXX08_06630 [Chloroflexi bacterium]|uniref:Uncharacterized protein n=1 Tax=Candidatus Chlorohelix allophototropha TaxID=3003348 RepID=A0A8T7M389_9CHLR|nr:hypothetical protein [Chloroflexota bacterium]WJW67408.1 hypothetical protein OZ401_000674 [Chloroflexota bacterium L227-S17]
MLDRKIESAVEELKAEVGELLQNYRCDRESSNKMLHQQIQEDHLNLHKNVSHYLKDLADTRIENNRNQAGSLKAETVQRKHDIASYLASLRQKRLSMRCVSTNGHNVHEDLCKEDAAVTPPLPLAEEPTKEEPIQLSELVYYLLSNNSDRLSLNDLTEYFGVARVEKYWDNLLILAEEFRPGSKKELVRQRRRSINTKAK